MAAGKKGAPAPRPRSGFVTEEQRGTERLTLRLDPETMTRLRSFAWEHGWSLAETVKEAFEALDRELKADFEEVLEADGGEAQCPCISGEYNLKHALTGKCFRCGR